MSLASKRFQDRHYFFPEVPQIPYMSPCSFYVRACCHGYHTELLLATCYHILPYFRMQVYSMGNCGASVTTPFVLTPRLEAVHYLGQRAPCLSLLGPCARSPPTVSSHDINSRNIKLRVYDIIINHCLTIKDSLMYYYYHYY